MELPGSGALCKELSQRGAVVVVADINTEGAQQVASTITTTGGRAHAVHLDVSQADDVQKIINETASKQERLDYIFNNAGISVIGEVRDMNLEHWRRVVDVNLLGVIYGTTAAYSLMVKQGFGHIVNTASLAGLVGHPTNIPYATTKYALVGLSTSLRAEAADLGVKISVVCPGLVQTSIYETTPMLKVNREDILAKLPSKMMMGATQAARLILRGVVRNKAIIIFPFHARFFWWLFRLLPGTIAPWGRKVVRDFRALRSES